jgi:hypothetical protein
MNRSFAYRRLTAFAFAAMLACGGGAPSRPGPLSTLIDEVNIARVPPDQRPDVAQTQNDYQLARSEQMNADQGLKESDTAIKLAKSEVDQATIEERKAKLLQKDAEASNDMNRKNAAAGTTRVAALGKRAADAKYAYVKAKRAYQFKWLLFTEHDMYAKQAKHELEKAKVAKANSIQPPGFAYDKFESQYRSRSEAAQRAKQSAEKEKEKLSSKERAWKTAEADWNTARGVGSSTP